MTNDCISREELFERLDRQGSHNADLEDQWMANIGINQAVKILNDMPSARVTASRDEALPPVYEERISRSIACKVDGSAEFQAHPYADWFCPVCGWFFGEQYVPRKHNQQKSNYCSRCGQKIDWENAKSPVDK